MLIKKSAERIFRRQTPDNRQQLPVARYQLTELYGVFERKSQLLIKHSGGENNINLAKGQVNLEVRITRI
jgi:hypothetical protein